MSKNNGPHYFTYTYQDGPLSKEELEKGNFHTINCRRAVQDYLLVTFNQYFPAEKILLPEAYKTVGAFITKNFEIKPELYKPGDIIYAERIKDKNGKKINKNRDTFELEDDWIRNLHSAVYIGNQQMYHATSITGETCIWDFEKFKDYYKIVAVKRALDKHDAS